MKDDSLIRLSDFYQAVILRVQQYKLVELEKVDSKQVIFVFKDKNKSAYSDIQKYWNRELKVQARDMVDAIVELKTRIHNNY